MLYVAHDELAAVEWETLGGTMRTPYRDPIVAILDKVAAPYKINAPSPVDDRERLETRRAQFEAVKRWFTHDWSRIDTKLRTSIVEGISVFLSLFDDNPKLKRIFCPPKDCYDPKANADGRYGTPLPLAQRNHRNRKGPGPELSLEF